MPVEPSKLSTPLAPVSWFRIVGLVIGYIVTLAGALSTLSIPIYASLLLMVAGAVIILLSDRTAKPMTPKSWIVLLTGCGLIFCVLALFGNERIHHWKPFPAGYIPAWFISFQGFRHIRFLISQIVRDRNAVA